MVYNCYFCLAEGSENKVEELATIRIQELLAEKVEEELERRLKG